MNLMETSDWLVLNNIIYKIYTTQELDKMRMDWKILSFTIAMVIQRPSMMFWITAGELCIREKAWYIVKQTLFQMIRENRQNIIRKYTVLITGITLYR